MDIRFGSFEFAPQSGNVAEQYIVISNSEDFAVDLSGWTLSGAAEHTMKPGTVIPANDQLFVVADVQSFLNRGSSPRGGEKRFIQANQSGTFSSVGGRLRLSYKDGAIVDETTYGVIGDFDRDGDYSCSDINTLTSLIAANVNSPLFDLNGDGSLDLADRDAWLAEAGDEELGPGLSYQIGDANLDGASDISDFNIWNSNKFQASSAWCDGDFNSDGVVDISDFNAWNATKFTSAFPQPSPAQSLTTRAAIQPQQVSNVQSGYVFSTPVTSDRPESTGSTIRNRSIRSSAIDRILEDLRTDQDFSYLAE
ncbi:MAG: lamin tail domain-containing protein [Planctomycetota bacterium]